MLQRRRSPDELNRLDTRRRCLITWPTLVAYIGYHEFRGRTTFQTKRSADVLTSHHSHTSSVPHVSSSLATSHVLIYPSVDHSRALRSSVAPLPRDLNYRSGRPHQTYLHTVESDVTPYSTLVWQLSIIEHKINRHGGRSWKRQCHWTSHMVTMTLLTGGVPCSAVRPSVRLSDCDFHRDCSYSRTAEILANRQTDRQTDRHTHHSQHCEVCMCVTSVRRRRLHAGTCRFFTLSFQRDRSCLICTGYRPH